MRIPTQTISQVVVSGVLLILFSCRVVGQDDADLFSIKDSVTGKAYPIELRPKQTIAGARMIYPTVRDSRFMCLVETGEFIEAGSVSTFRNQRMRQLVVFNLETLKLQNYELKRRNGGPDYEYEDMVAPERNVIEFKVTSIDRQNPAKKQSDWYHRNLTNGRVSKIEKPQGREDLFLRISGWTAAFPPKREKSIAISGAELKHPYDIQTAHEASIGLELQVICLQDRFAWPNSSVAPGNQTAQLVVFDTNAGKGGPCGISAYSLQDGKVRWKLSASQFEDRLGKKACIGLVPAHGLGYPCARWPIAVKFSDRSSYVASVAERKIEWTTEIARLPDWSDAYASDDGRYIALGLGIGFTYQFVLVDCEKQLVSGSFDFGDDSEYELIGVSRDGTVVLTSSGGIGMAKYDGKWKLRSVNILEAADD